MLGLIIINNLFSFYMVGMLAYLNYRRRPDIFIWHVGIGRFCILTRSTTSQKVFFSVYAQDFVSLVIGMFGWPLMKDAVDCDEGYEMFYLMTLCYQTIAIFRVIIVVVHFRCGQAIYRKLKQRF